MCLPDDAEFRSWVTSPAPIDPALPVEPPATPPLSSLPPHDAVTSVSALPPVPIVPDEQVLQSLRQALWSTSVQLMKGTDVQKVPSHGQSVPIHTLGEGLPPAPAAPHVRLPFASPLS